MPANFDTIITSKAAAAGQPLGKATLYKVKLHLERELSRAYAHTAAWDTLAITAAFFEIEMFMRGRICWRPWKVSWRARECPTAPDRFVRAARPMSRGSRGGACSVPALAGRRACILLRRSSVSSRRFSSLVFSHSLTGHDLSQICRHDREHGRTGDHLVPHAHPCQGRCSWRSGRRCLSRRDESRIAAGPPTAAVAAARLAHNNPPPSPAVRSLPAPRSFLPPRPRTDPQLAANARAIVENKGRDRHDLSRGDTRDEARARGQGSEALMTLLLELLLHAAHVPPYELFTGCGMSYDACHFFAMDSPTQGSLPFHYPIGNLNSFLVLRMCVVVGAARAAISSS
jgi:hypothetical protein